MLIEFRFKNFASYKNEAVLNLTAVKAFKELKKQNLITTNWDFSLTKSAAIFGSNAGGKSNLIEAMGFMANVVHQSFAESLKKEEERGRTDYYFKLSTETENIPTMFEVSVLQGNVIYRYGFEIQKYDIISEWLYKKVEVETLLFERKGQEFKINNNGFSEGNKRKKDVNANVLFLSHLAQFNNKETLPIFSFFSRLNVISGLHDNFHKIHTDSLLNKSQFRSWLNLAVRFLGISSIEKGADKKIISHHNKFDANNVIIGTVSIDFDTDESAGTRKLIYLLGSIYETLSKGKVLFVDELDAKLHPNMSQKLLEFFHALNLKNSQFIFTAHDASLLDKSFFRRDQIWFVDKNKFGSSELYAMAEFDSSVIRNTSDFRKKYLDSTFGAADSMEISKELIQLLHGQK